MNTATDTPAKAPKTDRIVSLNNEDDRESVAAAMSAYLLDAMDAATWGGPWIGDSASTELAKAYAQGAATLHAAMILGEKIEALTLALSGNLVKPK